MLQHAPYADASGPVILIVPDLSCSAAGSGESEYTLRANYISAVAEAGGVALIVPIRLAQLTQVLGMADGVLITGSRPGMDVLDERTIFERALVNASLAARIPLLGICHGMQLIGECLGGRVIRDDPLLNREITLHIPREIPDFTAHDITIEPDSQLFALHGEPSAQVNSLHRHALAETGRFRVVARAPDGLVEAIEADQGGFCLGVQWHPEYRVSDIDQRILRGFVAKCAERAAESAALRFGPQANHEAGC